MEIVLTGSLGHIGKPLTKILVQRGYSVTVISSNADRKKEIEIIGASAAIGSVEDVDFLTQAFKGADAVFCMVPPNFNQPDQVAYYEKTGNNYAIAIQRSGVKRVIDLSSYGAHLASGTGIITGSYKVENILNAVSGLSITHIRPGYFYYNLFSFTKMIKQAGFMGAVYGDADILPLVSPNDIADAIAEEITIYNSGKVRYVVSDEKTCNEVAQALGVAVGIPGLQWKTLPIEHVMKSLLERGTSENAAKSLVELGLAIHSGILREDYEQNKPDFLGKEKLTDFAREFAAVYNQQ